MNFSAPPSKSNSRSGWRVLAGIVFVVGVTLGLGFYLPLKQSHQLLTERLASAQSDTARLSESLQRAETSLKQMAAEHEKLKGLQSQSESHSRRFSDLSQRLVQDGKPALKAAFAKATLRARPLNDAVSVDFADPGLVNAGARKGKPLSRSGQQLSCLTVVEAKALELPEVTVRSFAAVQTAGSDIAEKLSDATASATALAEHLVQSCGVSSSAVSVAVSPSTSRDAASLRLEFRQPAPKEQAEP